MIKHIFSDMDGTLLNADGQISKRNQELINESNLPVTLVSARAPMEMFFAMDALKLKDYQVAFNGGLIFKRDQGTLHVAKSAPLPATRAERMLWMLTYYFPEVSCSFYSADTWYTQKVDEGICYEASLTKQRPVVVTLDSFFAQAQVTDLYKIILISFEPAAVAQLKQFLEDLEIPGITIQQSGSAYLELTSAQAKKNHGIAWILAKEKLMAEDTAAFGDGHNDLPMLKMVGTPIAMANAAAEVKEVAIYQTTSNNEDGVGRGIVNYLLTD